jgi:uncharacterized membrane protein YkvA (DUF1232 family)
MTSPTPAPNNRRRIIAAVLVGLGALAYGISPIDIIPDFLGPIGLIDDGGVIVGAAIAIFQLLKKRPLP